MHQGVDMEWREFFRLTVMKDGPNGIRPYFSSLLQVRDNFSIEELQIENFAHLGLSETEMRFLGLGLRKIILSHHYFHSMEFERIFQNFLDRLTQEKENDLCFLTRGGGAQLLLAALKSNHPNLTKKQILCQSSEPLLLGPRTYIPEESSNFKFIYHPTGKDYFSKLPSLGQIKLFSSRVA